MQIALLANAMGQEACPRCDGPLRRYPKDHAAVSRYDEATAVCAECGTAEGIIVLLGKGTDALHPLTGRRRWARWPAATRPASASEPE